MVYVFQRVFEPTDLCGGPGKVHASMVVEGPYFMYPKGKQKAFTPEMFCRLVVNSLSVSVGNPWIPGGRRINVWTLLTGHLQWSMRAVDADTEGSTPRPLAMLQEYWRQRLASGWLTNPWATSILARLAQCRLSYCTSVEVRFPSGIMSPVSNRVGIALVVPPAVRGVIVAILRRLGLCLPTLHLETDSMAGSGSSCTAFRGMHWGVRFIVKVEDSAGDLVEEWSRLRELDVVRSGEGWKLPIPFYYGLFHADGITFSILSDNGVALSAMGEDRAAIR